MSIKTHVPYSQFFYLIVLLVFARLVLAEVVLDGSLSGVSPVLSSPDYIIEQEYGVQKGSNLFHSFAQFNLDRGETAIFRTDSQIQNIISRVTGGDASFINGTIATAAASNVNLWVINPAGWLFAEHAKLNVQGSFHISTADAVTLKDSHRFYANPNIASGLSIAAPLGYEFTQPSRAVITLDSARLSLKEEGKIMSFVGGDINSNDAQLSSPVGLILIASNATPGTWEISTNGLKNSGQLLGNIDMAEQGVGLINKSLDISDPDKIKGGGLIQLVAANTTLKNISVFALSYKDSQGGAIQFNNSANLLLLDGSVIVTDVTGSGTGGTILIDAENLTLEQGSSVHSNISLFSVNSKGGHITINVADTLVLSGNGSEIASIALGTGAGGNIDIQANSIEINNQAFINTDTQHEANAGTIKIIANKISMQTGGSIGSTSSDLANRPPQEINAGKGGRIDIQASSLNLTDAETQIASSSFLDGGAGGSISLQTDTLNISNNAQVRADSTSKSVAGRISVNNKGLFKIDNAILNTQASAADGGQISIRAETLALRNGQVTSSVEGMQGDGGNISLVADNLVLNTGFIQANTTTTGGKGGKIQVEGKTLLASSNKLIAGGDERIEYQANSGINVIQAAAPDGISGEVTLNTVQLDISGELADVGSRFSKPGSIADNPCLIARGIVPSSLLVTGQGALPVNASDSINVSFANYLDTKKEVNQDVSGGGLQQSNTGLVSPCR